MGKKRKKRELTEEELEWERGFQERMRNLRELAQGRAAREWREKHGVEKAD